MYICIGIKLVFVAVVAKNGNPGGRVLLTKVFSGTRGYASFSFLTKPRPARQQ